MAEDSNASGRRLRYETKVSELNNSQEEEVGYSSGGGNQKEEEQKNGVGFKNKCVLCVFSVWRGAVAEAMLAEMWNEE